MALGVCLLFDRRSERALRALWSGLEERGVATPASHTHGRHHPHLSYVVLLEWHLDAVQDAVAALPDGGPFELSFDAVGVFRRGRVALVPPLSARLLARQQAVVRAVGGTGARVHRHYAVDHWVPHASVATRSAMRQLPAVAESVYEILPLTVSVTSAALIDSATGRTWPLPVLP
ncbi:2'-5' RNA ligase [Saccharomonospora piscinae]|uniref:2'-5' RNA ligase n=1 Tax=Saccharomonospora piscinae TaxID=687388 RepID=A0A1V8ZX81_SACPI|nr:2'-5' RNA ligase family protein [Saccharomonospora piscinae]OQO89284.1 2'-5' RNA ligase [Saccharomonospora piscinae]TLW90972.1 2'-5' RNA ligase family protein [Saccharomonospora piscinae]